MKKLSVFTLAIAAIFVSCKEPHADFYVIGNDRTAPCNVLFVNTSENAKDYFWEFGDGTTSSEKSPTHQYIGGGEYQVTLRAKRNSGNSSVTKVVSIQKGADSPTTLLSQKGWILKMATSIPVYLLDTTYIYDLFQGFIPFYERDDIWYFDKSGIQYIDPGSYLGEGQVPGKFPLGNWEFSDWARKLSLHLPWQKDSFPSVNVLILKSDTLAIETIYRESIERKYTFTLIFTH